MIPFLENKKNRGPSLKIKCLGYPLPENNKVIKNPVHVFDRYEIHIQAFLLFINGKFIFSNPHLHKIIFKLYMQHSTKTSENEAIKHKIEKLWYIGHVSPQKNAFFEVHIDKNNMFTK